jgi:L-ribulose-5-phosphate 4-epimerase
VLLKKHGGFTIGETAETAVKAAVMMEDITRTVWIALQRGQPKEIPPDDVAKPRERHAKVYGQ